MGDKKPYNYFGWKEGKQKEEKNGQEKGREGKRGGRRRVSPLRCGYRKKKQRREKEGNYFHCLVPRER